MSYAVVILSKTIHKASGCCEAVRRSGCTAPIVIVDDGLQGEIEDSLHVGRKHILAGVKPFVFARNANLAIFHPATEGLDIILLNDDARLETKDGFDTLAAAAAGNLEFGVVSALIDGAAAAEEQCVSVARLQMGRLAPECAYGIRHHMLAFVCVYIRRAIIDSIGGLDERFVGYGWEDDDYCRRLQDIGLGLGVAPGCLVEHGKVPSEYRGAKSAGPNLLDHNREIFAAKWGKH